jgi:hypothetical protein
VLADLIAPILDAQPTSFGIRADAFTGAINCGTALGCEHKEIGEAYPAHAKSLVQAIQHLERPEFIAAPHDIDRLLLRGISRYPSKPALVKINAASVPAVLSYDWSALVPIALPKLNTDYDPLRFIVPAYIQRTLRNRRGLAVVDTPLVTAVLRDLHSWLNATYNATFNLPAAEKIIWTPSKAHIALMVELNKAIIAEKIDVLPRPRYKTQNDNYLIRDGSTWWLNQKTIDKHFLDAGIVPNWPALLHCFTKAGVFRGEMTVHNLPGILIDKHWCDTFWSDYTDNHATEAG